MTGRMSDNVVSGTAVNTAGSPLAPGPAELNQSTWGNVSFEYLGCGNGRLSWDANDPSVTDGSVDVVQLAAPDGQRLCELPPDASIREATWID